MSSFKDRENAFENKYAHDQEMQFKATARRNKLFGRWAAGLLGLESDAAEAYVAEVIRADLDEPGEDDVIRKVMADFQAKGVDQSEHQVRRKLEECMAEAIKQLEEAGK